MVVVVVGGGGGDPMLAEPMWQQLAPPRSIPPRHHGSARQSVDRTTKVVSGAREAAQEVEATLRASTTGGMVNCGVGPRPSVVQPRRTNSSSLKYGSAVYLSGSVGPRYDNGCASLHSP